MEKPTEDLTVNDERRLRHVGLDSIAAERTKLLAKYDIAKQQERDDPTQFEHGNVAEDVFREYLGRLLPKKYGVAKGHIITSELTYDGPIEEWDIVIYDALESPTLFVRNDSGFQPRMGIPVEYVKAVIEVKASLTQESAKRVSDKLIKLSKFRPPNEEKGRRKRKALTEQFIARAVFFETKLNNSDDYSKALTKLLPAAREFDWRFSATVIRSQNEEEKSAIIGSMVTGVDKNGVNSLHDGFEASDAMETVLGGIAIAGANHYLVSFGFGISEFSKDMMKLIEVLNDGIHDEYAEKTTDLYGYGFDHTDVSRNRLWPGRELDSNE